MAALTSQQVIAEESFVKLPDMKPETIEDVLADEERWDAQFAASPDKLRKLVQQSKKDIQKGQTTDIILTDDGRMIPG